jgi:hypothetical protein
VVEAAEVEAAVVEVEAVAVVAVVAEAVVQGCLQHRGAIHCQTGERLHQTLPGSVGKELCRRCHPFPPPPHPYTFHNTKSM